MKCRLKNTVFDLFCGLKSPFIFVSNILPLHDDEDVEDPEFEAKFNKIITQTGKLEFLRKQAGDDDFKNYMADMLEDSVKSMPSHMAKLEEAKRGFVKKSSEAAMKRQESLEGNSPARDEL